VHAASAPRASHCHAFTDCQSQRLTCAGPPSPDHRSPPHIPRQGNQHILRRPQRLRGLPSEPCAARAGRRGPQQPCQGRGRLQGDAGEGKAVHHSERPHGDCQGCLHLQQQGCAMSHVKMGGVVLTANRIQNAEPGPAADRHHLLPRHLRRAAMARLLHLKAPHWHLGSEPHYTRDVGGQEGSDCGNGRCIELFKWAWPVNAAQERGQVIQ
jgi:hypothetical protein